MVRSRTRRRLGVLLSAVLIGAASLATLAPPVAASVVFQPRLGGGQEVPGPGDPDGGGGAFVTVDPAAGEVCVDWFVGLIDTPIAAHIHAGVLGVAGPVVVALPTPDATGEGPDTCVSGLDEAVLRSIVDDGAGYYVNVHTELYPDGAIRGQLDASQELVAVELMIVACGEGQAIDLGDVPFWSGCMPVYLPGDDPGDPPAGYTWLQEPIVADVEVSIDDNSNVASEADLTRSGDPICDPSSLACAANAGYRVASDGLPNQEFYAGDLTVRQFTYPSGFGQGSAYAQLDGGPPQQVNGSEDQFFINVSEAQDVVFVVLVNDAVAPPPPSPASPEPSASPSGSAAPIASTRTLPPTATIEPQGPESGLGAWLAIYTIAGTLVLASWIVARRRLSRRS